MPFKRVALPRVASSEQQAILTQKEFEIEDVAALISNSTILKTAHLSTSGLFSKPHFLRNQISYFLYE